MDSGVPSIAGAADIVGADPNGDPSSPRKRARASGNTVGTELSDTDDLRVLVRVLRFRTMAATPCLRASVFVPTWLCNQPSLDCACYLLMAVYCDP